MGFAELILLAVMAWTGYSISESCGRAYKDARADIE